MKTKRNTQILSAAFFCTVLSFFTATQADVTVKIDGTDKQWTLTEIELHQTETLRGLYEDFGKPAELLLANNDSTNTLGMVTPYLNLIVQVKNGLREEADLITAVTTKPGIVPGTTQEKETQELLALADAAYYWGVMPVGNVAVEHLGKRLCDADYVENYLRNPNATELSSTPDTRKSILKKMHKNSPALGDWLIQDQILNSPARDGQVSTTTFNHTDSVNLAVFNPDGSQILTTSGDWTAKLWNRGTGQLIHTFNHAEIVNSALFSPDGTQILTASYDSTAKLWDRTTGTCIQTFNHASSIISAVFSPDGSQILTASFDNTAKLWDRETGQLIHTFNHADWVPSALFSPDGTQILTASHDNTAKLWDRRTGTCIQTFNHTGLVQSAVFSPDGSQILTASVNGTAKLWNRTTGTCIHTFNHKSAVNSAVFSPDGSQILTASWDKTANFWDRETGQPIQTFNHTGLVVYSAVFNPDGSQILTTSGDWTAKDRTAKLWDRRTGTCIQTFNHTCQVYSAVFSPDGTQILTASRDGTAKLWNTTDPVLRKYVLQQMTLEQAMFLVYAYDCKQKNKKLDLDNPHIRKAYSSLHPRMQMAVNPDWYKMYLRAKSILLSPYVIVPAALAAGAGVGLWWWYKK